MKALQMTITAALLAVGCVAPHGPSDICEAGDECTDGLSCLNISTSDSGGVCRVRMAACSAPCSSDVDCEALGAGIACVESCGSMLCLRRELLDNTLVEGATCTASSQCRDGLECVQMGSEMVCG